MSFSIGRGGSPIQTTRNSENIRPIGRGSRSTPPPSRNSASPGIGGSPSPGSPGKGRAVGRGFPKHFNHQEKPNKVLQSCLLVCIAILSVSVYCTLVCQCVLHSCLLVYIALLSVSMYCTLVCQCVLHFWLLLCIALLSINVYCTFGCQCVLHSWLLVCIDMSIFDVISL